MSIREKLRDCFIEYEHVADPDNIIYLNTPFARDHARANAAQGAMSLEEDRRATRMAEIEEQLRDLQAQRDRVNSLMFTLENEHELLRKANV